MSQCQNKKCKSENNCQAKSGKDCESYPSAPSYPTATPKHLRDNAIIPGWQ